MLKNKCAALAAAVFAVGSVPASAQTSTTGSIEGTVTDPTNTAACPRGVVVKTNDCRPPGQAKQLFKVGQRVPTAYRFTPLTDMPMALRRQIPSAYLTGDYRYIYRDGIIYLVDSFNSKAGGAAVAGVLYAALHNND